jgi:hypothetical protein
MKMGMAEPGRLSRVEFEIQRTKAPYGASGTWRLADAAPARPPGDTQGSGSNDSRGPLGLRKPALLI